jgi:hypothetical protein
MSSWTGQVGGGTKCSSYQDTRHKGCLSPCDTSYLLVLLPASLSSTTSQVPGLMLVAWAVTKCAEELLNSVL